MKYESEILYDLMKRDGLLNPSQDNLPYESELKEKYVNDVVGAYPKLQDYRPEWLNYNKCEYIPADFPTESQTNQTSGTFENVVPFAYDVATLKGDTKFINEYGVEQADKTIFHSCYFEQGTIGGNIDTVITIEDSTKRIRTINPLSLEIGSYSITTISGYEVFVKIFDSTTYKGINQLGFASSVEFNITDSSNQKVYLIFRKSDNAEITTDEVEGIVSSSNIPELTSLSLISVQMPVLTTVGKNLNTGTLALGKIEDNGKSNNDVISMCYNPDYIKVMPNTEYSIKWIQEINNLRVYFYGYERQFIGKLNSVITPKGGTFITPPNCKYIRFHLAYANGEWQNYKVAIHKGNKIPTSYEPYQSNILTVNEEVELRGIGQVQDTLDCLTGEVTQRIAEITLDGSQDETWSLQGINSNNIANFRYGIVFKENGKTLCDKFIKQSTVIGETTSAGYMMANSNTLYIRVLSTTANNVESFRNYLASNPVTIQYEITTPVIKTVELSCINENNVECDFIPIMDTIHYQTSSNTIPPLVDLTVCVEATTQNLASFVDLNGVEHNE